jgi:catalase
MVSRALVNSQAGCSQAKAETLRFRRDKPKEVKIRHIGNCLKADKAYDHGVDKALDISLTKVPR